MVGQIAASERQGRDLRNIRPRRTIISFTSAPSCTNYGNSRPSNYQVQRKTERVDAAIQECGYRDSPVEIAVRVRSTNCRYNRHKTILMSAYACWLQGNKGVIESWVDPNGLVLTADKMRGLQLQF